MDKAANAIESAFDGFTKRTGLRFGNTETYPIECSAEYHFARMTGKGSTLVPLLYGVVFHIAKESKSFFVELSKVTKYLNVGDPDLIYSAARLLVKSGFFEVWDRKLGQATAYRPVGHKEWSERWKRFDLCCKKEDKPFPYIEDTEAQLLGRKLSAIFGGSRIFPEYLLAFVSWSRPTTISSRRLRRSWTSTGRTVAAPVVISGSATFSALARRRKLYEPTHHSRV